MPITLPPISRRRFLAGSLAAGAGLALQRFAWAQSTTVDPNRFVLLSDTHVSADPEKIARGFNMTKNMRQACDEALALDSTPAALFVNGDLAQTSGQTGDYEQFISLLKPVRERGIPIHLGMGNHDNRERFWAAVASDDARQRDLAERHVLVVECPRANWIVLDSLNKTNTTPGVLGPEQAKWLAAALDARKDKPALVMIHHQPDAREPAKRSGLTDTEPLMDVLISRKQVKVLFFGHTHVWSQVQRDGLHLVNLPAVGYSFNALQPTAWTDMRIEENAAVLQLHCLDQQRKEHKQVVKLAWRA